ncbi:MAG: hypothetical protein WBQ26_10435 [Gemmatimonadaceae bacterium]|nr:hypothetical protein [Gemmatimonadaceae bacterium]
MPVSRSAVTLLLLAAIIVALAVAALLLDVPVLVIAVGVGVFAGMLAAFAARTRRASAGGPNKSSP